MSNVPDWLYLDPLPDDEDEVWSAEQYKRWHSKYVAHPNCNDPDHPGCIKCEPDLFPEEWGK